MTIMEMSAVRKDFADTVNRVSFGNDRVVIRRRGKVLAGLVSAQDLALLEKLTNDSDYAEAREAIATAQAKGQQPVAWADAKKRLGL